MLKHLCSHSVTSQLSDFLCISVMHSRTPKNQWQTLESSLFLFGQSRSLLLDPVWSVGSALSSHRKGANAWWWWCSSQNDLHSKVLEKRDGKLCWSCIQVIGAAVLPDEQSVNREDLWASEIIDQKSTPTNWQTTPVESWIMLEGLMFLENSAYFARWSFSEVQIIKRELLNNFVGIVFLCWTINKLAPLYT